MCSGSEAGSYLRLIDFVYHSRPNDSPPTVWDTEERETTALRGVQGVGSRGVQRVG